MQIRQGREDVVPKEAQNMQSKHFPDDSHEDAQQHREQDKQTQLRKRRIWSWRRRGERGREKGKEGRDE